VTKSNFVHVELLIGDPTSDEALWVSSNTGGVHTIVNMAHCAEQYTLVDVGCFDLTEDQYNNIMSWVTSQRGKKYDYKGILFSQFIKFGVNDNSKWFCSELVTKILQLFGSTAVWDLVPSEVNPGMLYNIYQSKIN
jgi:uncharacterized protein YycO